MRTETIVNVTDRTYKSMVAGAMFERWPGDGTPGVGERVTIFDRNLDFTQHDVVEVDGSRVRVGPAIPFDRWDNET